jgi:hypothetical protein
MGESAGKMDGVLARAAADFQNLRAVDKANPQHLEDGVFVALAGGGERKHMDLDFALR